MRKDKIGGHCRKPGNAAVDSVLNYGVQKPRIDISHKYCAITQYGFDWGPASVRRCISREDDNSVMLEVISRTNEKNRVQIYISGKGRSIRVFKGTKELK
jgi:hypothetical protein